MIVLVVNNNRYLFNDQVADHVQDETAKRILSAYPEDADVWFDEIKPQDLSLMTNSY